MTNADITVDQLEYWIERATNEYDEDNAFHAWDVEYAIDTLNGFLPNLGDYVSLLRRERPMSTAEFYRRALATLYNIFQELSFKDSTLADQINAVFSQVLEYKSVRN